MLATCLDQAHLLNLELLVIATAGIRWFDAKGRGQKKTLVIDQGLW